MPVRFMITAAILAVSPVTGVAQPLPPDCSTVPAPKQPVEVSVGGTRLAPKSMKLIPVGTITFGDEKFDSYRLSLRSVDSISAPLEAEVTVVVPKGQRVDGRVFRRIPTREIGKQPLATAGMPEVQGWSLRNRPANANLNHVRYVASLRLEFGQRQGATIPGNIYLCVARGQKSTFDKAPTQEDGIVAGTFEARIQ